MKTTITDVAKQAGVSMKTVSRVLNNEPNVAKKTREKVLAIAKELRYSPNLAARGLASSKSYMIALTYDNSPSLNYISPIQQGAIMACRENGFHLVVEPLEMKGTNVSEEMERLLERLPVDGIILTSPLCDNPDVLAILKRLGVAYVSVSPSNPEYDVSCVVMDNTQAAYEMTEFLIREGHRNIGFIKGHPEHNSSTLRYLGFVKAIESAGIEKPLRNYFQVMSARQLYSRVMTIWPQGLSLLLIASVFQCPMNYRLAGLMIRLWPVFYGHN